MPAGWRLLRVPTRGPAMRAALARVPWWTVPGVLAVLVVVAGWLPLPELRTLAGTTVPVLGFVLAVTVLAGMCATAGLFEAAGALAVRLARGSRLALWSTTVVLATVCTVVLSLDTTAVLLTPVVIAAGRRAGVAVAPLALTVVALANTASLLLPVSNLTNLLAENDFRAAGLSYLAVMWAPALAVLLVTVLVLALLHRRSLAGRFEAAAQADVADRFLLRWCTAVMVLVALGFLAQLPAWAVATGGVLLLGIGLLVRWTPVPLGEFVPWRMLIAVAGLFVLVQAAQTHGLHTLLAGFAGSGDSGGALARFAAAGAVTGNVIDNLPAFLALAPLADSADRLATLLVSVNAGPIILPWGSLATLLWWQQVRRHGGEVDRWWTVIRQGLVLAPLVVAAGVGATLLAR
ncbi:SLC13 family permease [Nakamurella sp. A5-74]|uniref:SLC13 family permease n=1 Tax=Nakamurella sp. A5-74 TaxID=3158264 RepID=A0AAU8DNA8_9ACTN